MRLFLIMVFLGSLFYLSSCEEEIEDPADKDINNDDPGEEVNGKYANEVLDVSGDPYCVNFNGSYYLYLPLQNGDGTGGKVLAWTSTNLLDWTDLGEVYENTYHNYGGQKTTNLWAPEVMEYNGKYYLFVVNVMSDPIDSGPGDKDIVIIEGSSPTDFSGEKTVLLNDSYAFIDPSPFIDPTDSSLYLTYKRRGKTGTGSQIDIRPMSSLAIFSGDSRTIFHSDDISGSASVLEHPHIREEDGKYFLFFSKNSGKKPLYKIDYAVAGSVMANYVHKGTLFESDSNLSSYLHNKVIAPGGSSIVVDGSDKRWMVYRQKTTTEITFGDRVVCVDQIEIFADKDSVAGSPSKGVVKEAPTPL
jgi:beta-xylosidase